MLGSCLLFAFLLAYGSNAQICNNADPTSGGLFIPAFGSGGTKATLADGSKVAYCTVDPNSPFGAMENGCVPPENDPQWGMAVVYLILLLWSFIGVGIVADQFMSGIETITSKGKIIEIKDEDGKVQQLEIKTWNPTVANLTLMALGSSAPEILLNVIEILSNDFYSGSLGPSTIVGSAAFNLMVIMGVCVSGIPKRDVESGETGFRKIDDLGVYAITAFFSVFAYLWLVIILMGTSPNAVGPVEGGITLFMFPLLVVLAWLADTGYFTLLGDQSARQNETITDATNTADVLHMAEKHYQISRAQRRVMANRALMGAFDPEAGEFPPSLHEMKELPTTVEWELTEAVVVESTMKVTCNLLRHGPDVNTPFSVDYKTVGDTATPDVDYESQEGTLHFAAGEVQKEVTIVIINDDEVEPDEFFFIDLSNFQCDGGIKLAERHRLVVRIISDDVPGVIEFLETDEGDRHSEYITSESIGEVTVHVVRKEGCSGVVTVDYKTVDGTAVAESDYVAVQGTLTFESGEAAKSIKIEIVPSEEYENDEHFTLVLENVQGPEGTQLGGVTTAFLTIKNEQNMKRITDRVIQKLKFNKDRYKLGTSSWKAQWDEAIALPEVTSTSIWILWALSLPWKIFGAVCPPTVWFGGWLTFFIALTLVAIVTVLIGDLASLLGCSAGLKDSITAITFVALGTSLPDTFASKAAAVGDSNADAAVGNVTGSNSVNVFLGLGLPWFIASIYWAVQPVSDAWRGKVGIYALDYPEGIFIVEAGDLAFSVIIFTFCSLSTLAILYFRRVTYGAELGGENSRNTETSVVLVGLWIFYVLMSSLKAEGHI